MTPRQTSTPAQPAQYRRTAAIVLAVLLAATPAFALTAGDVLDRMNDDQRHAYVWAAVEMAMYLAAVQEKNEAKANCIGNWFFPDGDTADRTAAHVAVEEEWIRAFVANKDRPAAAVLNALINRHCGPRASSR